MKFNSLRKSVCIVLLYFITVQFINGQSLKHPHIWVSDSDKAKILDNIDKYEWAKSMFVQLKERNEGKKTSHKSNPSNLVSTIPSIPGDRNEHREHLNIAVECGIMYYLTGDEEYAQVAADILHHYSKMIHVLDPLNLKFYTSHHHLIQTREVLPRFGIIYDFVYSFISKKGIKVYDLNTNSKVDFDFSKAQKSCEVLAECVLKVGGTNSNHPVLELTGALYNILSIEDDTKRNELFNRLWYGDSKQNGITWMLDHFTEEEDLWPEPVGYARETQNVLHKSLNVVDRYIPDSLIIQKNARLLESIFSYENFKYPSGVFMAYGDSSRDTKDNEFVFRIVLAISDRLGIADIKQKASSTLKSLYTKKGGYQPEIFNERLEWQNPLQLLWGVDIPDAVIAEDLPICNTITAKFAGVVMQRNYVETNNEQHGLMYYTGGGTYVHSHASGIDMELYGAGYVLGPDYGSDTYGTDIHEQYAVSYAAHNTIIVNGTSGRGTKTNGNSTWQNIVDPIVLEASEPAVYAGPIADSFSFSTQFLDDNQNDVDQQRTNSIIRTSPTSGYYVDIYRSVSNTTNDFHDYLFHGLGDVMEINSGTNALALVDTPDRFQNDVGDDRKQPGWRWYSNVKTSALTEDAVNSRFELQYDNKYLHVNVPAGVSREYSTALAPPTKAARNGYSDKDTQMFIMRKYGEAWDEPFVAIYEPSGNQEGTVKSTSIIYDNNNKVVGVKVISEVNGAKITDLILSNDKDGETLNLNGLNIVFKGRFGIVRTNVKNGNTTVSLYIGKGEQLVFENQELLGDTKGKGFLEYTLDYEYEFNLASNNFLIETVGETCTGEQNGSLTIDAVENRNYIASINGKDYNFNKDLLVENLSPGNYNLCITIEGASLEQCYKINIVESSNISGGIQVKGKTASISIEKGTAPYRVLKNGNTFFETNQSNFSIEVTHNDEIQIKGKSDCQGVISKRINLFENIQAYPNPTNGTISMYIPTDLKTIKIKVFNLQSQLISSKIYQVSEGRVDLKMSDNSMGVYIVKVNLEPPVFVKVIKK